jgi:hypothetical protein
MSRECECRRRREGRSGSWGLKARSWLEFRDTVSRLVAHLLRGRRRILSYLLAVRRPFLCCHDAEKSSILSEQVLEPTIRLTSNSISSNDGRPRPRSGQGSRSNDPSSDFEGGQADQIASDTSHRASSVNSTGSTAASFGRERKLL